MSVNLMPVFIAKAPGRLCEGLCSLLENQPSIKLMGVIQNEADLVQSLHSFPSAIILLDIDLFGKSIFDICLRLKRESSQAGFIILVDTIEQKKKGIAAGANEAFMKGYTANELLKTIQRIYYARLNNLPSDSKSMNQTDERRMPL